MSAVFPQTVSAPESTATPNSFVRTLRRLPGSVFAAHLGLRVFALPASLATTMLLSQTMGPAQFGSYAYVLAWVSLLAVPATLGFEGFLVKEVSAALAVRDWGLLRGLIRGSERLVWLASLTICGLGFCVTLALSQMDGQWGMTFQSGVGFALVPLVAMRQLSRSTLQGLQRPLPSVIPELFVQPITFLLLVAVTAVVLHGRLSSFHAVTLQVAAGMLALVAGRLLLKNALPREIHSAPPRAEYQSWLKSATPFLLCQLIWLANEKLSVLTLGMTAELRDVGVFALSSSLAMLVMLPIITMDAVISGRIAHLLAIGDKAELQRQLTRAAKVCVLVTSPIALTEIFGGHVLLSLFREDFSAGQVVLAILAVGQFVNVASGSVGTVLTMAGHTRDAVIAAALSTAIVLACCVLLIPAFGAVGAAIAHSTGIITFKAMLVIRVRQRLGIDPTLLSAFRRRID